MQGISTRPVDDLLKAFLEWPIEVDRPYLWNDAGDLKVRRGGRVGSVAVIIATSANSNGGCEVLRLEIVTSEVGPIWTAFLL